MSPQEQIKMLREALEFATMAINGCPVNNNVLTRAKSGARAALAALAATSLPAQPIAEGYEELARLAMSARDCVDAGYLEIVRVNGEFSAAANPAAILTLLAKFSSIQTDLAFSEAFCACHEATVRHVEADRAQLAERVAVLEAMQSKPFGFFHELLDHEGNGNGVWLGSYSEEVTRRAAIEGETGKEVVALYRATPQPHADEAAKGGALEPMQPIILDEHGRDRFRENVLVRYILDNGGIDLNHLATVGAPVHDREQFAQLIGYSLAGYGELSYVTDESYYRADAARPIPAPPSPAEDKKP
jgi:hypothetical protein